MIGELFKRYTEKHRIMDFKKVVPFINNIRDVLIKWYTGAIDSLRVYDIYSGPEYAAYWNELSKNPDIPLEFIRDNIDMAWNWGELSSNTKLTWDFVVRHRDKDWLMYYLSKNNCITFDHVKSEAGKYFDWDFAGLSSNPNITWAIIKSNPEYPWNLRYFGYNPNLTWEVVKDNVDYLDWWFVSSNPMIDWKTVRDNLDCPWNWSYLTANANIDWATIENTWSMHPWDDEELGRRACITMDIVNSRPDIKWNMRALSWNPNLSIEKVREYHNKAWRWHSLSMNPSFAWSDITSTMDDPEMRWDTGGVCQNVNIFDVQEQVVGKIPLVCMLGDIKTFRKITARCKI